MSRSCADSVYTVACGPYGNQPMPVRQQKHQCSSLCDISMSDRGKNPKHVIPTFIIVLWLKMGGRQRGRQFRKGKLRFSFSTPTAANGQHPPRGLLFKGLSWVCSPWLSTADFSKRKQEIWSLPQGSLCLGIGWKTMWCSQVFPDLRLYDSMIKKENYFISKQQKCHEYSFV